MQGRLVDSHWGMEGERGVRERGEEGRRQEVESPGTEQTGDITADTQPSDVALEKKQEVEDLPQSQCCSERGTVHEADER